MIPIKRWLLYNTPVDGRKGVEGLMMLVMQAQESLEPQVAYLFSNRSATRLKVLTADQTGYWLSLKRLHKGRFIWPQSGHLQEVNAQEFSWLCAGLDWQRWDETLAQPKWL